MKFKDAVVNNVYRVKTGHGSAAYGSTGFFSKKRTDSKSENDYGNHVPNPTKGVLLRCTSVDTMARKSTYVLMKPDGTDRPFEYTYYKHGALELYAEDTSMTGRQRRAQVLRENVLKTAETINSLKLRIKELEDKMEKDTFTADALEKYETDDEALAAMMSEVLKSDGSAAEIAKILKMTGVTARL